MIDATNLLTEVEFLTKRLKERGGEIKILRAENDELRRYRDGTPVSEALPPVGAWYDNTSFSEHVLVDWFYADRTRGAEIAYLEQGERRFWHCARTGSEYDIDDPNAPTRWWPLPKSEAKE